MSIHAFRAFDRRQIFRFFIDGRLLTRYRGWVGYEANEPRSAVAMLSAFCLIFDNFDLSQGLRAGYLKQLHKTCTLNVGMRNAKTSPGDLRYLESAYTFHAGVTTLASLEELFELRRGDRSPLFFTKGYNKPVEKLDVHQVYQAIQDLGELKYRPWYPRLTEQQKAALDKNGTRIFDCSFEEFYRVKLDIQMQYALKLDEILDEFNTTMPSARTEHEKLLAISKVVRKLELLHAFPDGNGRTYVPALMNHLLLYHGFYPAILYNPNWDAELSYLEWVEEMKRGMDNTRLLLRNPRARVHNYSIDDADEDSIAAFADMTTEFGRKLDDLCDRLRGRACPGEVRTAIAPTAVQRLLALVAACDSTMPETPASEIFDPESGTLLRTLDCSQAEIGDEQLAALDCVRHIRGDLILRGPNITRLTGLDSLQSVSGTLVLDGLGIHRLNGFDSLETAGDIQIGAMPRLTSINGFDSLLYLRGGLRIAGNPRLTDINGFNTLASVGRSLVIADNACLCGINGFNALRRVVRGSLELRGNSALAAVNGMRLLQQVGDTLLVSGSGLLEDFGFLAALERVRNLVIGDTGLRDGAPFGRLFAKAPAFPGGIRITGNARLADVRFLRGLQSVASSLYLHQNGLASLDGLESLEKVGASFTLSANALTDLAPLARLRQVDGVLSLSNNRLRSLDGLEALESIRTVAWNGTPLSIKLNGNRGHDGSPGPIDISALAKLKAVDGHLILVADEGQEVTGIPSADSAFGANKVDILRQR